MTLTNNSAPLTKINRQWVITSCSFVLSLLALASGVSAGDVVVVCPDVYRPVLEPWCDLRRDDGLTLAFCLPQGTATETAMTIRQTADESTRYVVLVGDSPEFGAGQNGIAARPDARAVIPTFYLPSTVTARHGSTPTYPTDLPYGDLDGDGMNDVAVGRLPVANSQQLADLVARIAAYETSQDFGPWRRCMQLTAGVGGFGTLIDGAIESVTRTILTSVLPPDAKPQIAYASPGHTFCPVGDSFGEAVMQRYQNGARFWVYAGHGSVDRLNLLKRAANDSAALTEPPAAQPKNVRMSADGQWQIESLLDNRTAADLVTTPGRAPIAILLACYAGAYDAPNDCLSERMLLAPGGPIAVIAASRLTMPYGNARFGLGLLESAYVGTDDQATPNRLGDAMLAAVVRLQTKADAAAGNSTSASTTQLMVDGLAGLISPAGSNLEIERNEHAGLYQLLGDPTLRLQAPQTLSMSVVKAEAVKLSANELTTPPATRTVCVSVTSPIAGTLTVCVDRPLTSVTETSTGENAVDDPHGCTLAQVTLAVESQVSGTTTIKIPRQWSGPVLVRGFVQGKDTWATGATRTLVD
jgi:hypothetical protein